ncbi:MAG TPA: VacB/RNase II family 3'-5' exoribonuclease [Terriglobia bacterium]|nr:VacB/RNase II family 3'-5' exoribonuclease [Terriglobia bacterium]
MRELPLPSEILRVFERHPGKTFRLRELVLELGLRSSQARDLKQTLKDLSRLRKIVYLKKNHFALPAHGRNAAEALPRRPHEAGHERTPSSGSTAGLPARRSTATGRLIGHRDGYGFVVTDQPVEGSDQDIFVPPGGMGSAMHGDRVEVQIVRARQGRGGDRGSRLEGRVIRVMERAQRTVVGEFRCGSRSNYVAPYDQRIATEIVIPRGQEWPSEERPAAGQRQFGGESEGKRRGGRSAVHRSPRELDSLIVDVEITEFPGPALPPRGRVIEILGRRDDFGVDVEIIIRKFHLPHRFPLEVLAEAEAAPQFISEPEREGRRDYRSLPIVTIDGETAKDFDDAVHVERLVDGNFILQVHIADVAHYVRPGTGLDREARLRGTSVYFPDRAVPMLPLELSNGICSLNPHVDRLVMSVQMEIDPEGRVVDTMLAPGIIRSAERMTYTAVNAVLTGDAAALDRYQAQAGHFKLMELLARLLNRRREARGSIDFDLPEPEIEFDEYGRMIGVTRSERNIAHRIIEEFMLVANEAVARYLERRGVDALYRIHEKPDPKKVLEFEEIASTFGYSLGVQLPTARRTRVRLRDERDRYPRFEERVGAGDLEITSRHYQRLTERIAGKPEERILSYLMLRSLKQARYSEENVGHFALASPTYTHFTSPIRRYPDLIVHRILKAALASEGGSARVREESDGGHRTTPGSPRRPAKTLRTSPASRQAALPGGALVELGELRLLALETSEAERRAADAERELMEWKKVSFMAERLGDEFEALVISVTKYGFFVELTDLFVEGFVPLDSFEDDRYVYRERLRAVVGERSKRAYRLGERIRVRLDRIDRAANKLQFSVAE